MRHTLKGLRVLFLGLLVVILLILPPVSALAEDDSKAQKLVDEAKTTFETFMVDPDMEWFRIHMGDSKGLLIVPSLVKAGFVLGGSGGHGALLVRNEQTGTWTEPAFYSIGSGSLGLQIGAQVAEVIMVVRSEKGLESLYKSSFKLGGDAAVAAGPVGAGAAVRNVTGDIISFTRAKGAFVGMSFEGAVVKTNDKYNSSYYGKSVRPTDILVKQEVSNPNSAELRRAVAKAAHASQKEPVSQAEGQVHEVQSGDTLYGIAKKYGMSLDELCSLNSISKDQTIYPGQKIQVAPGN